MSLFIETIKINNGRRINLDGHSKRMNFTRNRHFHEIRDIDLREEINVPESYRTGVVKCRVTYDRAIQKVEFEKYVFKNPRTFQLVKADHIDYRYKSEDRSELTKLYEQKGNADDIIMVKDGFITDAYYANIAFLNDGVWYTPSSPMLEGTYRRKLILNEKIVERVIKIEDLYKYTHLKIFNALTEWNMHLPVIINEKFVRAN